MASGSNPVRRRFGILAAGIVLLLLGGGCLVAWALSAPKPATLTWDAPVVRSSIMSFAYKTYGNPEVDHGKYYLSKMVLKNSGGRSIRDLSVSYQIPDYIGWTTPEMINELPPGYSTSSVFYPRLPEKIARLDNRTNATLEIKLQWKEDAGAVREQVLRRDFVILGRNEIQYCDLASDDIVSFYDTMNLGQFAMCMVTPNDPVVKQYAAEVTKRIGGTLAGIATGDSSEDNKSILELMKTTYDYMQETGLSYVSAEGVPEVIGEEKRLIQTVRMPRDVIMNNSGLCIELTLLWASLMTYWGCDTYMVFIPGHAFIVVQGRGQPIPLECTAITPKAVGQNQPVPFEKAIQMAGENFERQRYKVIYSVQRYRSEGYAPPELADVDIDRIHTMLVSREPQARPDSNGPSYVQGGEANPGPPPAGELAHYRHRAGLVGFDYPQAWQTQPVQPGFGITFDVEEPGTMAAMQVLEVPRASTVPTAFRELAQAFARVGIHPYLDQSRQQGDISVLVGHTSNRAGVTQWIALMRPVHGGVIGVVAGCPAALFDSKKTELLQLLGTVRFQ